MLHPINPGEGFGFHTEYDPCCDRMRMFVLKGQRSCHLVFAERELGETFDPLFSMPIDQMQHMFNSLWAAGFRPPERALKDDIVGAKNDHLDDLRKVNERLFGLLVADR